MPLNSSSANCDLSRLENDDRTDSTFYSSYYLKRRVSSSKDNTKKSIPVDFDQSMDIDHLRTYPKIVFLGTVGSIATSVRNNTSILVQTT